MNIVDSILFQSEIQPKAAALCAPGSGIGLISYGRLAQFIHNIARNIRKLGLAPGQIVATSIKDEIFQAAVTLALARLNIASVSNYDDRVADAFRLDAVIADTPVRYHNTPALILADLSWTRGDSSAPADCDYPHTAPSDLCRIVLTSGSMGEPKAVGYDHRNVAERVARNLIVFGSRYASSLRIYCDMPISTAGGFRHLISTLWRGGTFFFPGETFEQTVDAFEEYRVQCVAASPGGLELLLKGYESHSQLQSKLEVLVLQGDVLPRRLADRVRMRICPHVVLAYGASEVGTTASAPLPAIEEVPNAVGFVSPGVAVLIVNDTGEPMPSGREGLVCIQNPLAVQHYIGNPVATAKAFRKGWFVSGDIGVLQARNILCIRGRQDARINLGGDKINPERVEAVLAGCGGVVECAVFGSSNALGMEEMWVAVVAEPQLSDDQLRAYCESHLGPQRVPAGFVRVDRLPRNQMGKIERSQLPELRKRPPP